MKNIIMLALLSVLLIGCTTEVIKYKYVEVEVMVPVPVPAPDNIEKPILPTELLTDKDKGNYPKISKAYAVTVERLKEYSEKLNIALDVYRPKEEGK